MELADRQQVRSRDDPQGRRRAALVVQRALRVGAVDDPLEREADEVAREVVESMQRGDGDTPAVLRDAGAGSRIRRAVERASAEGVGKDGGTLDAAAESR